MKSLNLRTFIKINFQDFAKKTEYKMEKLKPTVPCSLLSVHYLSVIVL
jgi:hypothetical protein